MGHEPGRLVRHLERAVQLMAADALLAGGQQVGGLEPLMNWNLAILENGADLAGELFFAAPTSPEADPTTFNWGNPVNTAAMGANRAGRPHNGLQPVNRSLFIMEMWL